MILEKKKKFDTGFCALIWIKNFIVFGFKDFLPKSKFKFLVILVDFLASSPFKIYSQLFDIFIKIFGPKTIPIPEANFVLKNIEEKLDTKTKTKKGKEFLTANLSIMEYLLSFCSKDFFYCLEKIMIKIWNIIGSYKLIQYEETFDACLVSIIKNFQLLYFEIFENNKNSDWRQFVTSIIMILHVTIKKKKIFENINLKLNEKIYSFITLLTSKKEEEFTLYIPVFFRFSFLKCRLNNNKTSLSALKWCFFLSSSINFKILFRFYFLSCAVPFYILFLNKFNSIRCEKIKFLFRIISFSEKIFYKNRIFLSTSIINSLRLDKKKKIFTFFFQKLFSVENKLNLYFHNFSMRWSASFLRKNGNSINGILLSLSNNNCQKILMIFAEIFFYKIRPCFFVDFSDFFSLYRFQLSIRNLFDTIFFIFNKLEKEQIEKTHSSILTERCICVRGNDGKGKLIFFFEKKKTERFIILINKLLFNSSTKNKNQELFFKLIMRLSLISNLTRISSQKNLTSNLFFWFEHVILKNLYNLSCQYIMEIIFLDNSFTQFLDKKFSKKIFKFGMSILSLYQENLTNFFFDFFGFLIYYGNKSIFDLICKHFFHFFFRVHLWGSKFLSRTILKFLRVVIDSRHNIFKKKEIITLFVIGEINLLEFGETEELYFFFKSLIENFDENGNFISHLIEVFLEYYFVNQNFKSTLFMNNFLILFIKKKGTVWVYKECEKIKKNLFLFLIFYPVFVNFRQKISVFCLDNFSALLKLFFLQEIPYFRNFFLEKLMEKTVRKIIFDLKQLNRLEQKKGQKISRFYSFLFPNQFEYYVGLNSKAFVENILEKIKSTSFIFPFRII